MRSSKPSTRSSLALACVLSAGVAGWAAAPAAAPASAPYLSTPITLPGTIEAEHFDDGGPGIAFHDQSAGNAGGAYRATDVDIENTRDTGGGYNLGWVSPGEWLAYTVNVAEAGAYTIGARVAAPTAGGIFHVEINGVDATGPITVPATGEWQAWRTVEKSGVRMAAGTQVLRLVMDSAGSTGAVCNVNWLRATAEPMPLPPTGSAIGLPGIIEAENFDNGGPEVAFHDDSAGNSGGVYRATDVDIEATRDAGGGYNVGWVSAGEWLAYSVNVAGSGTYTVSVRVASPSGGGTFHVESDGSDVTGPFAVPATGDWQAWRTLEKTGVRLAAGVHVLRLAMDTAGGAGAVCNVNWIRVSVASSLPYTGSAPALPGTIEAENFDNGSPEAAFHDNSAGNSGGAYRATDVDIEETRDTGGGYNVGWMSPGEWLAYTVNVAAPGSYTISARVAAPGDGGVFHVESAGVNLTGPVAAPATGGWQSWQTVETRGVRLAAGVQVLRLVVDAAGSSGAVANVNWLRVSAEPAAASFAITAPAPGALLRTASATFRWSGTGDDFWLTIGSAAGQGDVYSSGSLGPVAQHTVPRLPLNGQALYVELHRRVGPAAETVAATYTAPVRRALAIITDFTDRRLEDWTGAGIRSEADLAAQLGRIEAHWAWLSRGLEKVQWDTVRIQLPRPAAPGAFSGWVEFRDIIASLVSQQVSIADYDVDLDGALDVSWSVLSNGDVSLDYALGGASRNGDVNIFVDGQASDSVKGSVTGNFSHEMGHLVGLPDMYGQYGTLSSLTIMSYSWDLPPGDFAAYERMALGWLAPLEVRQTTRGVWLPRAIDRFAAVKVPTGRDSEYFLIEYRQKPATGYGSADVDYNGLIVYHVLEGSAMWQDPPIVEVEPADRAIVPGRPTDPFDFVYPGNPYWTSPLVLYAHPDAAGNRPEVFRLDNVNFQGEGMSFDITITSSASTSGPAR